MSESIIVNEGKEKPKRTVSPDMQGTGKVRKPSASKKFAETFMAEDAGDAGRFIFQDVFVPIVKDGISSLLHSTVDALFGGSGRGGYANGNGRGSNYIAYDKRSRSRQEPRDREPRDRERYSRHGVQDIVIDTKPIAEAIIEDMIREVNNYGEISISSYYEIAIEYIPGLSKELDREYTDDSWGWTSMRDVYSQRLMGGGYRIVFPRPKPLDR